jgi:hypothetical protein
MNNRRHRLTSTSERTVTVVFNKELDTFIDDVQLVKGTWTRCRQRDYKIFHIQEENSGWLWWSKPVWVIKEFAGADTAAIGGGAVWYDTVETFDSEADAVLALRDL